jgi:ABC-type dipeptide/oligopeptide/nickel transport system permease subunit
LALDIKTRDYIRAAETRGENPWYIMFVEILPNARGPILVDSMLRVGYAIFAIGTLGFLGIGLPPPDPDWGNMVNEARKNIFSNQAADWQAILSTLVIVSTCLPTACARVNRYQKERLTAKSFRDQRLHREISRTAEKSLWSSN